MERLKSKGSQSLHLLSILRADLGQEAWHLLACGTYWHVAARCFAHKHPLPPPRSLRLHSHVREASSPALSPCHWWFWKVILMLSQRDGAKAKRDFSGLPSPWVLVYFYSLSSLLDHLYHHDIETLPWYNFCGIRRQHLNLEIDLVLN